MDALVKIVRIVKNMGSHMCQTIIGYDYILSAGKSPRPNVINDSYPLFTIEPYL